MSFRFASINNGLRTPFPDKKHFLALEANVSLGSAMISLARNLTTYPEKRNERLQSMLEQVTSIQNYSMLGVVFLCVHIVGVCHLQNTSAGFLIYVWLSPRHQASSNVTKLFSKSGGPSSSFDYCFQFHSTNDSCRQVGCKEQTSKQTKDYARQGSGQVCTLYQNANDMCIYHTQ